MVSSSLPLELLIQIQACNHKHSLLKEQVTMQEITISHRITRREVMDREVKVVDIEVVIKEEAAMVMVMDQVKGIDMAKDMDRERLARSKILRISFKWVQHMAMDLDKITR